MLHLVVRALFQRVDHSVDIRFRHSALSHHRVEAGGFKALVTLIPREDVPGFAREGHADVIGIDNKFCSGHI